MERVMLERGDLRTFHEPFIYLYYLHRGKKRLEHFEPDSAHPTSYEDTKQMLLDAARSGPVFVKDMCYYVSEHILADETFLRRIRHTYLIRHPRESIASYFRLDPELTCEEVGLEAQYRQFEATARLIGTPPLVIDAADLVADTERVVRAYCSALGLPFLPHALTWSAELPQSWRFVAGWHRDLGGSVGIDRTRRESIDVEASPRLKSLYVHHLPFYRKLRRHRLQV